MRSLLAAAVAVAMLAGCTTMHEAPAHQDIAWIAAYARFNMAGVHHAVPYQLPDGVVFR